MIVTIIFILIFLIGISLFVAVVGTAFLRRHSRRITVQPREYPIRASGGDFSNRSSRYRREFVQTVKKEPERELSRAPEYFPPSEGIPSYKKMREAGAEGKWFLITIAVLVLVIFSFYFGVKGYQNITMKPKLYFCENVDFVRQRPINKSDTFTRGNVTVFVKSRRPLGQEKVRVDVYKIDTEGLSPYASKELPLKPDWTSFSFKTLFDSTGSYTVMVHGKNDRLLDQENIFIVPDSYAYKPVRR